MREPSGPGVNFSTIIGELDRADRFDLCAIMTLLLMLLYGGNALRLRVPITILVIAALIFAGLRRRPAFWLVLTLSYVLGNAPDWLRLDNHKYLMGYWSLAFCFACLSERPMKTLAFNARVMIGLCFVLAVVWKLSTPDFVDGTFFQFTLLNDRRLAGVARAVGRVTAEIQQTNRAAYRALLAFDSRSTFAQLGSTPQVAVLAAVMTAWTIGLEALIGLGFLVRRPARLAGIRDYLLLLFIASTYALAPVVGFGWLLVVMGFAQAEGPIRYLHLLYVAALLVLQLDRLPWQSLL